MNMIIFYIYLFVIYDSAILISAAAIISVPPVDTVGCYGGETIFYCGSERDDINHLSWTINSDLLTDEIMEFRRITVNQTSYNTTSLTIAGLDINDGIAIGCVVGVFNGPPYVDSKGAIFAVSDIPPVVNLTIVFTNNGVMNITWSKPLSCTPVNYSYNVSVNTDVPVLVPSTILQYSVLDVVSCMNYTVSVTVIDTGYTQYHSIPVTHTAYSGYYEEISDSGEAAVVLFEEEPSEPFAKIFFNCSKLEFLLSCNLSQPNFFEDKSFFEDGIPEYNFTKDAITLEELSNSCQDFSDGIIGYYTTGPFPEGSKITYSLYLNNTLLLENDISTFNVQRANITQNNDSIETMMECVFASNSSADGCSMELILVNGTSQTSVMVPKPAVQYSNEYTATLTTVISEGYYNVSVYDIVEGTTLTSSPAYTITHLVIHTTSFVPMTSSTTAGSSSSSPVTSISTVTFQSVSTSLLSSNAESTNINNPSDPSIVPYHHAISAGIAITAVLVFLIVCVVVLGIILRNNHKKKMKVNINAESAEVRKATATPHIYDEPPHAVHPSLSVSDQVELQPNTNRIRLQEELQPSNANDDYLEDVSNYRRLESNESSTDNQYISEAVHSQPTSHQNQFTAITVPMNENQFSSDSNFDPFSTPSTESSILNSDERNHSSEEHGDSSFDQIASSPALPQQKPSFSEYENVPFSSSNIPSSLNLSTVPTRTFYADLDLSRESCSATETRSKPIPKLHEPPTVYSSICTEQSNGKQKDVTVYMRNELPRRIIGQCNPLIVDNKVVGSVPCEEGEKYSHGNARMEDVHVQRQSNEVHECATDGLSNCFSETMFEEERDVLSSTIVGHPSSSSMLGTFSSSCSVRPSANDHTLTPLGTDTLTSSFNTFGDSDDGSLHSTILYPESMPFRKKNDLYSLLVTSSRSFIHVYPVEEYNSQPNESVEATVLIMNDKQKRFCENFEAVNNELVYNGELVENYFSCCDQPQYTQKKHLSSNNRDINPKQRSVFDGGGDTMLVLLFVYMLWERTVFDGGGSDSGSTVFDGGGTQPHILQIMDEHGVKKVIWWYTFRKWLYDKDWFFYGHGFCLWVVLSSLIYTIADKLLNNNYFSCIRTSDVIMCSLFDTISIPNFKKRKKKTRLWNYLL